MEWWDWKLSSEEKIKAQIREKGEAKQAYDDAKARGLTAALAEEKTGDHKFLV